MTRFQDTKKKQLLYVEDRPMPLTERILRTENILPVIIRFKHLKDSFSEEYLNMTERKYNVFWVDIMNPLEQEAKRFSSWQERRGIKIEYFLNPSEVAQYYAQAFARQIGLPCLTEEQTICCRNKIKMKDKLQKIGLNTADYQEVWTTAELISAGNALGWPIVLCVR